MPNFILQNKVCPVCQCGTKIGLEFKGKNQLPLLMIYKEWINQGEVTFATCLFQIWDWEMIKFHFEMKKKGQR